jgi:programmed cell death protein 5
MEENKQEQAILEQIKKMELAVKPFLTGEALERLNNLKIAHQDKWLKVLSILYQLIASGQVKGKITDEQLKRILASFSERRKTRIKFIRR